MERRVQADARVVELRKALVKGSETQLATATRKLVELLEQLRIEVRGEVAKEYDGIHTIGRALAVGSIDRIITAASLREELVNSLERGMSSS